MQPHYPLRERNVDAFGLERGLQAKPKLALDLPVPQRQRLDHHPDTHARLAQLQQALLGMSGDEEGRTLLRELHLDGCALADAGLYSAIEAMLAAL